jgi:hypothetical protein
MLPEPPYHDAALDSRSCEGNDASSAVFGSGKFEEKNLICGPGFSKEKLYAYCRFGCGSGCATLFSRNCLGAVI